jgi:DNA-binding GntR family transcriptional regulator
MREADAKNNIDAVVDADESFHRGLLVLSKNNRLADIGLRYRDLIQRAHLLAVRLRPAERIENSIGAHQQLFDLLVKGDALAAREAHYHQRVEAGNELIETLANYNLNNL